MPVYLQKEPAVSMKQAPEPNPSWMLGVQELLTSSKGEATADFGPRGIAFRWVTFRSAVKKVSQLMKKYIKKKNQQKEIRWNRGIVTLLLSPAQVYGKERQRHRLKLLWHFWLPSCHVFFFMMQLWPNGAWTAFSCLPRYIKSWCNLHTIKRRKPPLKTALSVDKTNLCCYA